MPNDYSAFTRENFDFLRGWGVGSGEEGQILKSDGLKSALETIEVTQATFREKVSKLAPNKATGPDLVPSIVLQGCTDEQLQPLALIMQRAFDEGVQPVL